MKSTCGVYLRVGHEIDLRRDIDGIRRDNFHNLSNYLFGSEINAMALKQSIVIAVTI